MVRDDYVKSYAGQRFFHSIAYVRSYPKDLAILSQLLLVISTPVLILVGRNDPYGLHEDARLLHQQLSNSELVVLETQHNAWEEDPEGYILETPSVIGASIDPRAASSGVSARIDQRQPHGLADTGPSLTRSGSDYVPLSAA